MLRSNEISEITLKPDSIKKQSPVDLARLAIIGDNTSNIGQHLEPSSSSSTMDQLMNGTFDSIKRQLNPDLGGRLENQWNNQYKDSHNPPSPYEATEIHTTTDRIQEADSRLLYNPTSGWQGTPRETLKGLVRKAIEELDIHSYSNEKTLARKGLYPLYRGDQKSKSHSFDKQTIFNAHSFDTIDYPEDSMHKEIKKRFIYFRNTEINKRAEKSGKVNHMRMVLNVKPDRIIDVTQQVIDTISQLEYVSSVKIAHTEFQANAFDNMIIYFTDPTRKENVADLAKRLGKHADDTRSGHSAMLEPIRPEIQGICIGDDCYNKDDLAQGLSWGGRRVERIAEALWSLKSQEADFETIMSEVDKRFREDKYAIDPENPAWYIH